MHALITELPFRPAVRRGLTALGLLALFGSPAQSAEPASPLPACPPDWRIEVIAEAPDINHPTVIACTPDGRAFVAEDPMDISAPADKPLGRIRCVHPDGTLTTFAEGLHAVFGMQYVDGKLYVLQNPKFSVFEDPHDAAARRSLQRDRVDLIECTNPNPWALDWNDHIPANFRLGMDGFFYFSVGDKGVYGAVGKDGSRLEMHGGGVVRFRPDATALEVFATGTRNCLDLALNDEDEIFTYDNTDERNWLSRAMHIVDGGYYGYPFEHAPPAPHILPPFADYGPGAATGVAIEDDGNLPESYRGSFFIADWGRREVLCLRLEAHGGTYRVDQRIDFLAKAPPDFRPVGIAFADDGQSLYVADWRHPDTKASVDAGRLLRVTFTGDFQPIAKPAWYADAAQGLPCRATISELLVALSHPSRRVRACAQRRLIERKSQPESAREARAALSRLLLDARTPTSARRHALWALDGLAGSESPGAETLDALADADPSVRRQAVRQAGLRRRLEAVPRLLPLLGDGDAAVRRLAAAALGRCGALAAVPRLLDALDDNELWVRQAAWTALGRIGRAAGSWTEIAAGLTSPKTRVGQGVLFSLRDAFDEAVVAVLARFLSQSAPAAAAGPPRAESSGNSPPAAASPGTDPPAASESLRPEAVRRLASLHRKLPPWKGEWWAYHPVDQPPPRKTDDWAGTRAVLETLRSLLHDPDPAVRAAAVDGLREARDAKAAPLLRASFTAERDVTARRRILRALGELADPDAAEILEAVLDDPAAAMDLADEALAAAERVGGARLGEAVRRFAARSGPAASPSAALVTSLRVLGAIGGDEAVATLSEFLAANDPELASAAARALVRRRCDRCVPAVLQALERSRGDVQRNLARALAQAPTPAALGAYLHGLDDPDAGSRDLFRAALRAIETSALPELEHRFARGELSPRLLREVQRIFATPKAVTSWRLAAPLPPGAPPPMDPASEGAALADAFSRSVAGPGGEAVVWKEVTAGSGGLIELGRVLTAGSRHVAFAHAFVESRAAKPSELLVGSGGPVTLWLNGEQVHATTADREWGLDQDRIPVRLRAGANSLLVRTEDLGGGAAISVRIPVGPEGAMFDADAGAPDPLVYRDRAIQGGGNIAKGQTLFRDERGLGCAKCHRVAGEGGAVGPDLSGIGAQYDRAYLAESVLFPSKIVRDDFRLTTIVTQTGELRVGVVRGETAESIVLLDAEGARHEIPKAEVQSRETGALSLMPEGLIDGLSPQEFADLVSYLETLRAAPPRPGE